VGKNPVAPEKKDFSVFGKHMGGALVTGSKKKKGKNRRPPTKTLPRHDIISVGGTGPPPTPNDTPKRQVGFLIGGAQEGGIGSRKGEKKCGRGQKQGEVKVAQKNQKTEGGFLVVAAPKGKV